MGKLLTVNQGYSAVLLPSQYGLRNYSPGDQVTVTDAEYAAFNQATLNAVTVTTSGLPDPARKASDSQARPDTVNATATGAITAYLGWNDLTLTGNVTSVTVAADSPSTGVVGPQPGTASGVAFRLVQDATGSRTVAWGSKFKFAAGTAPVLSTAAGKVDIVEFVTLDGGTTFLEVRRVLDVR
jgi:hypothetical protein